VTGTAVDRPPATTVGGGGYPVYPYRSTATAIRATTKLSTRYAFGLGFYDLGWYDPYYYGGTHGAYGGYGGDYGRRIGGGYQGTAAARTAADRTVRCA
jgi:hypothetical protein